MWAAAHQQRIQSNAFEKLQNDELLIVVRNPVTERLDDVRVVRAKANFRFAGFVATLESSLDDSRFLRSRIFKPTILPVVRSRTLKKLDIVPETVSRNISYFESMSTLLDNIDKLVRTASSNFVKRRATARSREYRALQTTLEWRHT